MMTLEYKTIVKTITNIIIYLYTYYYPLENIQHIIENILPSNIIEPTAI